MGPSAVWFYEGQLRLHRNERGRAKGNGTIGTPSLIVGVGRLVHWAVPLAAGCRPVRCDWPNPTPMASLMFFR